MPDSLNVKLSKLRHKGQISEEEYEELKRKLSGHDKEIRNKAIDDLIEIAEKSQYADAQGKEYVLEHLKTYAEQLKEME